MNSLHSHACTHVTPLGNHFTVLNSINDDPTVFNLNQVNTSVCCNDDYYECNPHDISALNVPKDQCVSIQIQKAKRRKRMREHMCPSLKS